MTKILIDLHPLSTPSEKCHTLTVGPLQQDQLQIAKEQRFDQLPVLGVAGELVGLISTDDAEKLFERGESLNDGHPSLHRREVPAQVDLFELLSEIEQTRAVVFRGLPNGQSPDPNWFGLVTLSDLNRHHFRAYLYPLFARLETALAELIRLTYDDDNPWDWIWWAPPHNQATIIGRWEMDKKENIETSPVNGCELRDLLQVLTCSKDLKRQLRYPGEEIAALADSLPRLRNDIMHPVRALVHSKQTVGQLRATLESLKGLTLAVEAAERLHNRSVDPETGWHPLMIDRLLRSMEIAHQHAPSGWSFHADKGKPLVAKLTIGHKRAIRMGRDLNEILIDRAGLHAGQIEQMGSVTFVRYSDAGELEDPYLIQIPTEDLELMLKMLRKNHERVVSKLAQGAAAQYMERGIFTGELADHLRRVSGQILPTPGYMKTGD